MFRACGEAGLSSFDGRVENTSMHNRFNPVSGIPTDDPRSDWQHSVFIRRCHRPRRRTERPVPQWPFACAARKVACDVEGLPPLLPDRPGPANAKYVNHALMELREWAERENVQSLAIPRLCRGVGGMSWDAVAPLVRQRLGLLTIPVYATRRIRRA